jgi:UDP-N-acetylglucosamine transferase subunit ALG13
MTTLCVATDGGHLAQLIELGTRLGGLGNDTLWVTFETPQSRSLLADRKSVFIRSIGERDVGGVCRGVAAAHNIISSLEVDAVISTGSAIALSFLPYAAARGISAHYIESAARVGPPSLTGRLLERIPRIQLYRQYPHAARGRWKYAGSVFDGFETTPNGGRTVRRVVVTLGSGVHAFRRLLDRLVAIIPPDLEVLWQTGSTPVDGLPIEARPTVPAAALENAIREADVVIGHAGCGSALTALNSGKYPVLVPREPQYGELVDSHQVELARFLGEQGLACHRSPETISFEDMVAAAAQSVSRRATPPMLRLA